MLVGIIAHYLESHRRLIIPQMGAFIVKEPGRGVLFSELLKRDDGVLRGLLVEAGTGEIEAAGAIDRFVFEVRHAVQEGRTYPLAGLGILKAGPNGTIAFDYAPQTGAPAAAASEPAPVAAETPANNRQVEKFADAVRTLSGEPAAEMPTTPAQPAAAPTRPAEPTIFSQPPQQPAQPIQPAPHPQPAARPAQEQPLHFTETERPVLPKMPQLDSVWKTGSDFSASSKRSKRDDFAESSYGRLPRRPAIEQTVRVKKRSDHFIWIALIAAAIALAAIAFGGWVDSFGREDEAELFERPASQGDDFLPSDF